MPAPDHDRGNLPRGDSPLQNPSSPPSLAELVEDGVVALQARQIDAARDIFEDALKLARESLSPLDPQLSEIRALLITLYLRAGLVRQVLELTLEDQQVLVDQGQIGTKHYLQNGLACLGLMSALGEYSEATRFVTELHQESPHPDNSAYWGASRIQREIVAYLAELLCGNEQRATQSATTIREHLEYVWGPEKSILLQPLKMCGDICFAAKRYQNALEMYSLAAQSASQLLHSDAAVGDPLVRRHFLHAANFLVARAELALEDLPSAAMHLRQLLSRQDLAVHFRREVVTSYRWLLQQSGLQEEVDATLREQVQYSQAHSGSHSRDAALDMITFSDHLIELGRFTECLDWIRKTHSLCIENDIGGISLAGLLHSEGICYRSLGKPEEAFASFANAMATLAELPTSTLTIMCQLDQASVYLDIDELPEAEKATQNIFELLSNATTIRIEQRDLLLARNYLIASSILMKQFDLRAAEDAVELAFDALERSEIGEFQSLYACACHSHSTIMFWHRRFEESYEVAQRGIALLDALSQTETPLYLSLIEMQANCASALGSDQAQILRESADRLRNKISRTNDFRFP